MKTYHYTPDTQVIERSFTVVQYGVLHGSQGVMLVEKTFYFATAKYGNSLND